jgi:hypothetical protein
MIRPYDTSYGQIQWTIGDKNKRVSFYTKGRSEKALKVIFSD